jgi:cellulose synthase/poly-beta-1,6-N-acetylglucosamine synthase-like glycosyltransferase
VIHLLIGLTGILLGIYAGLIFYYHRAWDRIPAILPVNIPAIVPETDLIQTSTTISPNQIPIPPLKVSLIIPARNEASHIGGCLQALFRQSYPSALTEIIIVNDFSTDNTSAIVTEYRDKCRLLNLSDYIIDPLNAYKKKAIEIGIAHSSGDLIICTDADCTMGPDWVSTLVSVYTTENCPFIAAPVKIIPTRTVLSVFQALDFISLQGITGAAVYKNLYPMCNGANLAYTRTAFEDVGGFSDIDHIASGDDMLLMRKIMARFPGKPVFIKDQRAIVSTGSAANIRGFFSQRIRWASKISHYKHTPTFLTLALVFLVNLCLLLLFLICIFFGHWRWLLILVAFKTISEYFFVSTVADFFGQKYLMKYFPLCQPFHIAYTVIAGSFGSFGKYEWKNRKVK